MGVARQETDLAELLGRRLGCHVFFSRRWKVTERYAKDVWSGYVFEFDLRGHPYARQVQVKSAKNIHTGESRRVMTLSDQNKGPGVVTTELLDQCDEPENGDS